ncbi:hypothetical protein HOD08_03090, partial [bacterium]|nr:hypothetical protein [bacterium]
MKFSFLSFKKNTYFFTVFFCILFSTSSNAMMRNGNGKSHSNGNKFVQMVSNVVRGAAGSRADFTKEMCGYATEKGGKWFLNFSEAIRSLSEKEMDELFSELKIVVRDSHRGEFGGTTRERVCGAIRNLLVWGSMVFAVKMQTDTYNLHGQWGVFLSVVFVISVVLIWVAHEIDGYIYASDSEALVSCLEAEFCDRLCKGGEIKSILSKIVKQISRTGKEGCKALVKAACSQKVRMLGNENLVALSKGLTLAPCGELSVPRAVRGCANFAYDVADTHTAELCMFSLLIMFWNLIT